MTGEHDVSMAPVKSRASNELATIRNLIGKPRPDSPLKEK
jgi:hypothetical protein